MSASTVEELIEHKKWEPLRKLLATYPAPEIAEVLANVSTLTCALLFHFLPRTQQADVFSYLESEIQKSLLTELTDQEAQQVLSRLSPDDRTALLEVLPEENTARFLNLLNPQNLEEAQQLLQYPEESVGRLMTPDYVAVSPTWTVARSLEHIREVGKDIETSNMIYVTDIQGKLIDALELQRFVMAAPSEKVDRLLDESFIDLSATDDREKAVYKMQKYALFVLPVVDSSGVLLGIVTADDVFDVAEEEATEDIQKGAAITPLKTSYRESSIWSLYRKRLPWLGGLIIVNLAAAGVIAAYEETLASALILAFFIPILLGSGGNTGAQAATLMVRALATNDVKETQWLHAIVKEIGIGCILGVTMGLGIAILGVIRGDFIIGLAVGLAMTAIVLVSNLIGASLPVLLTKLGFDPATASSPMVTSTVDVTSLVIYFSIANLALS